MKSTPTPRLIEVAVALLLAVGVGVWIERMAQQRLDQVRLEFNERPSAATEVPGETGPAARSPVRGAALDALPRAWLLSLLLAGGVGALLTAVFYRRLIRPLRAELSESRTHLERQEKLASLGVLAAGIAHEIRNPLTAMKVR